MPDLLETPAETHNDEYVDGTGDVKSQHAQGGGEHDPAKSFTEMRNEEDATMEAEAFGQEIENSTSVEANETREMSPAEQLLIDGQLEGVNDSLSNLDLLLAQAQSHLSVESSANLSAMAQSYEKDRAELVQRILSGEDVSDDIDVLNQRIKNQIAFGSSQLVEAKAAGAKEDNRHGAEVAGRTVVASYEARKAAETTQDIPNPQSDRESSSVTDQQSTVNETAKKISKGERELGTKYGRAANLMQELLDTSSYRGQDDDPLAAELKSNVKQYLDLSQLQLKGDGRKPGFGDMREINRTIDKLQDALFVRQQNRMPSGDKESEKRLAKINKSDNKYKKFV